MRHQKIRDIHQYMHHCYLAFSTSVCGVFSNGEANGASRKKLTGSRNAEITGAKRNSSAASLWLASVCSVQITSCLTRRSPPAATQNAIVRLSSPKACWYGPEANAL